MTKNPYKFTTQVAIKNKAGSSKTSCACGSWINHWEKYSTYYHKKCSIVGCEEDATDGAHIYRTKAPAAHETNGITFIIPMCSTHNNPNNTEEMLVEAETEFVWANKSETCEKMR